MNWNLLVHPQSGRIPRHHVSVHIPRSLSTSAEEWEIHYEVSGAQAVRWPPKRSPRGERRDELWNTTCLELFVQPSSGPSYVEWNFSPSLDWACYEFSAYRRRSLEARMRTESPPRLEIQQLGDVFNMKVRLRNPFCTFFDGDKESTVDALVSQQFSNNLLGPLDEVSAMGLTAVIEEVDGAKFYWALQHSSKQADFHRAQDWLAKLV